MRIFSPQTLPRFSNPTTLVMLLSFFYWSYLALTSQMIIFHDSLGYQKLAMMFANGQWKDFFPTGPNREPLYSLIISLSIRIARWQNLNYLAVQTTIQVGILLATQLLTLKILRKLNISDRLSAVILAYLGFSHAIASSGLILFSEIITYPLVLWLVYQASKAWTDIKTATIAQIVRNGLLLALASLLITFTKGIFEIITLLLLLPYVELLRRSFAQSQKELTVKIFIFLTAVLLAYEIPVVAYKSLNKKYNGMYALTNRGSEALYGNTARRMEPLSKERLKTALAYTAGSDVCAHFYAGACSSWGFLPSDILGDRLMKTLQQQGLNRQQISGIVIKKSIQEIMKNPLQYIFLDGLEGAKLLFWESPLISYIVYPDAIDRMYSSVWLRYPLRFLMAGATLLAIFFGIAQTYKDKNKIFNIHGTTEESMSLKFYLIFTVLTYIGLYSFFFMSPRYALPIVPLYLIIIAWCLDHFQKN